MIIIFGAPGAGKTVQGQLLVRKYGWGWLSSRSMMLSLNDRDVSLALNNGMPIDNAKSVEALKKALSEFTFPLVSNTNIAIRRGFYLGESSFVPKNHIVLDGVPNNISQLYYLIENGYLPYIQGAINLRVPRGELWCRLVARGRADDTRAAIERRQDLYDRAIFGMIHTLRENNIRVADIDGRNSKKDVLERIEERLADWEILPKKSYPKL